MKSRSKSIALSLCGFLWLVPAVVFAQNTNQRILDIRKLGKSDSNAIPTLAANLSDPNPDVRVEAVRAIVKIGTAGSLDPLVKATQDSDPDIQILATDGIVNFYLPGYVATGVLSHPLSRGMKQVKAVLQSRNRQEIGPEITLRSAVQDAVANEIAHAQSFDVRSNAARAAGILHDGAAVPALQEALRSRDTGLILESLYALQKIGSPAAGSSVAFLVRDFDEKVQLAALETVGVLKTVSAASDVRSVFQNPRNQKAQRAALLALAVFGLPEDRPTFQQYASDKDVTMRAAALEGLGRVREPEDTPLLTSAFNETNADWRVHLAAAFALVDEGQVATDEFSPLRYLVENVDAGNRDNIAQAYLTELCNRQDVRKGIYTMLPQASVSQKVALCPILASTRASDAVAALQDLAKDPNPDVSLSATKSLRVAQSERHK